MKKPRHLQHPLGFLYPTRARILVTLFLVILFLPFVVYDTGIRCITVPCDSESLASPISYALFHSGSTAYGMSWELFIGGLIGTYIVLSILSVLIYSKKH